MDGINFFYKKAAPLFLAVAGFAMFQPVVQADVSSSGFTQLAVNNTFIFNPRTHSWKALNKNGSVVRSGKASGGSTYCRDLGRSCKTPSGVYRVYSKGSASCRSSRYPRGRGGAAMPYCMFFKSNYAIHGASSVPGYNASHGCIRVQPSEARWLHQNFINIGTTVVVKPY